MFKRLNRLVPGLLVALAGVAGPVASAPGSILAGYPDRESVSQGESLGLNVCTDAPEFSVSMVRQGGGEEVELLRRDAVPGHNQPVPEAPWDTGCGWGESVRFEIPRDWPSGGYLARLTAPGCAPAKVRFYVTERTPGSRSRALLLVATFTHQAYNKWGGQGLYTPGVTRVSCERPFDRMEGGGDFERYELDFVRWCEESGRILEIATDLDLHRTPALLEPYDLLILVGHSEYWTSPMRAALNAFLARGGNLAHFGANALYWQMRVEADGRNLVCYRQRSLDPLSGVADSLLTVRWRDWPLNRPEAALLGVGLGPSCFGNQNPLQVFEPGHWVLQGADTFAGDRLGQTLCGYEWDVVLPESPPRVDVVFRTPMRTNDGKDSFAAGTYYERTAAYGFPGGSGARIFSAGTIQWSWGLRGAGSPEASPVIVRATENVLDALGLGSAVPVAPEVIFQARIQERPAEGLFLVLDPGAKAGPRVLMAELLERPTDGSGRGGDGVYSARVTVPRGFPDLLRYRYRLGRDPANPVTEWRRLFLDRRVLASEGVLVLPVEDVDDLTRREGEGPRRQVVLRLGVFPNPFSRGTTLSLTAVADTPVRTVVQTVNGMIVTQLRDGILPAGLTEITWDGRDDEGRPVPGGVYFLVCRTPTETFSRKLTVMR